MRDSEILDYKMNVQLEHTFLLAYYLGFTKSDIDSLPIQHRLFYIRRVQQEINRHNDTAAAAGDGAQSYTKGAHDNTPSARMFRGQTPNSPARLRRFS